MRRQNRKFSVLLAAVIISMAALSTHQGASAPAQLTPVAEARVEGGMSCASVGGLAAGLAIGALSPCSVICALGAWYAVGAGWLGGCWN